MSKMRWVFVRGLLRRRIYSNGRGLFLRVESIGIGAARATARHPCHRFKVREGWSPFMQTARYDLY